MTAKKRPSKREDKQPANPDFHQIERLLEFMADHNLEEFEYARGDFRIRLKKPSAGVVIAGPRAGIPEIIVAGGGTPGRGVAASVPAAAREAPSEARTSEDLHIVKSPIVGTFYESPSPGSEPFVRVGDAVEVGQTLCIVEAMKLMNEIESDMGGEVMRVFAENGQPVEYGQPLFGIRPSRKK